MSNTYDFDVGDKNDFLDLATEEWIVMRLRQYERTNNACFIPREPPTPRGGAAYRKRRRTLTFAIAPLKIAPKVCFCFHFTCYEIVQCFFFEISQKCNR